MLISFSEVIQQLSVGCETLCEGWELGRRYWYPGEEFKGRLLSALQFWVMS